ncbi:MAG TPA: tetratricopeptide repeat protein [Thermoanaerobaculia bacterium]|nr:tetratricopeptide repeat protein [Thermoanaerobaculia bacterium]HUM30562.1 tetratricopeptide repeat protein [Thermoanaerobaculia bacterium]HXK68754.1 tetratricopeptide repeat protein [Thermoanaerobaculia bacterium]
MLRFLTLFVLLAPPLLLGQTISDEAMDLFMDGVAQQTDGRVDLAVDRLKKALKLDPENTTIALTLAEACLESYRTDEATEILQDILARHPDNLTALQNMARIYTTRKEFSTALLYYQRAHEVAPEDPEISTELARMLFITGDKEKGVSILEGVDSVQAYWLLSSYYLEAGNLPLAERNIKAFLRFVPGESGMRLRLSQIQEQQGRYLDAAETVYPILENLPNPESHRFRCARLFRMGGSCDRAIPLFESLMESSIDPSDVRMELGRCYVEAGRWDEAQALFSTVQASRPEDILAQLYLIHLKYLSGYLIESLTMLQALERTDLTEEASDFLLSQKADIYTYLGNWEAAEASYMHLWEKDPSEEHAIQLLDHYELVRCYKDALRFLKEAGSALSRDRKEARAFRLYMLMGDEEAARILHGSLVDRMGEAGMYLTVQLAMDAERYDLAHEFLDEMVASVKDEIFITFSRAAIYENLGKSKEAGDLFHSLLAVNPDDASTLNYLGYMKAESGEDLDRAKAYLIRAVEIQPSSGAYLDSLGWVYFKLDQLKEAEYYLIQAFHRLPHDPVVIEHLGDLYNKKGNRELALFYYRHAIRCFSTDADSIISKILSLR